jgi:hypothetical protein
MTARRHSQQRAAQKKEGGGPSTGQKTRFDLQPDVSHLLHEISGIQA